MKKGSMSDKINEKMQKSQVMAYFQISDPGDYAFRILPQPSKLDEPAFEKYVVHQNIYVAQYENYSQFTCLGVGCPLCEYAREFEKSYPQDAWRVKKKDVYYWRIRDNKDGNLKILKITYAAQSGLIQLILNYDKQGLNLQDLEEGRDIRLTVKRVNDRVIYKFEIEQSQNSKTVSPRVLEELNIWDSYKPLDKLFRIYNREELRLILQGQNVQLKHQDTKKKASSKSSLAEQYAKKMGISGIVKENEPNNNNMPETDSLSEIESDSDRMQRLKVVKGTKHD